MLAKCCGRSASICTPRRSATVGARAEDVFYVTDRAQQPLDDAAAAERLEHPPDRRARSPRRMNRGTVAAAGVSVRAPASTAGGCARPRRALSPIALSIGEPRHESPAFVLEALRANLHQLGTYPVTRGLPAASRRDGRGACSAGCCRTARRSIRKPWCCRSTARAKPCSPSRRPSFDAGDNALVAMPNPGYQIYEGAALLAGAEPYFLNTTAATGYVPDLDAVPASVWQRCRLLYLCSPGNPTGAVLSVAYLRACAGTGRAP